MIEKRTESLTKEEVEARLAKRRARHIFWSSLFFIGLFVVGGAVYLFSDEAKDILGVMVRYMLCSQGYISCQA